MANNIVLGSFYILVAVVADILFASSVVGTDGAGSR